MAKEYLIECRGLTWKENCELADIQNKYAAEHDRDNESLIRTSINFLIEKIYPKAPWDKMTAGEAMAVYKTTMELTMAIRDEEIKNYKPLSAGSTNELAIAETAEK